MFVTFISCAGFSGRSSTFVGAQGLSAVSSPGERRSVSTFPRKDRGPRARRPLKSAEHSCSEPRARRAREAREALEAQARETQAAAHAAKMAKAAELAASSRAERVDKVRDHLQRVDDAVKLAKKLDANSPAKRWATIMAKADPAPSAPAAKSERLPPLAVAIAVVAAAYVVRALFAKE